jgi:hypothetical protein
MSEIDKIQSKPLQQRLKVEGVDKRTTSQQKGLKFLMLTSNITKSDFTFLKVQ